MASVYLTVTLQWRREEGSGQPCFACGDPAFLTQKRLYLLLGECDPEVMDTEAVPASKDGRDVILCGTCSDT